MKKTSFSLYGLMAVTVLKAQYREPIRKDTAGIQLLKGLEYKVEMQGSFSKGHTPLWLNANKYGLSSLGATNGYLRGGGGETALSGC